MAVATPGLTPPPALTATTSSVPASVTSVTALATNTARKGASIVNDSMVADMYLKCGAGADTDDYSARLGPQEDWDTPSWGYLERIDIIWTSTAGTAAAGGPPAARITEYT